MGWGEKGLNGKQAGSTRKPTAVTPHALPLLCSWGVSTPGDPTTSYDTEGLFSGETKWPQIEMPRRSIIRGRFKQRTEGWHPAGTTVEVPLET